MKREVMAWSAQAEGHSEQALIQLRAATDAEDSIENLPVKTGPIVPARKQLGELLLEQGHPSMAAMEFQAALVNAPGRKGAWRGAAAAASASKKK